MLRELYPNYDIAMLNLVDQNEGKRESLPGRMFSKLFNELAPDLQKHGKKIAYIPFDYHAETIMYKWGWGTKMMQLLQNALSPGLSFYHSTAHGSKSKQTSLVRTNCIDCLDRTNVVQSFISKFGMMESMLRAINVEPTAEELRAFDRMVGGFWADNADSISKQYAGSPALKTDIARRGHRTRKGMMHDLKTSLRRHLNAIYYDQFRRVAMAIVYGPDSVDKEPKAGQPES
jgi:hypothetical protein